MRIGGNFRIYLLRECRKGCSVKCVKGRMEILNELWVREERAAK